MVLLKTQNQRKSSNFSLTKRAADVWESARFRSIFLTSSFFYISNIVHARPHAANANRSAAANNKVKT